MNGLLWMCVLRSTHLGWQLGTQITSSAVLLLSDGQNSSFTCTESLVSLQ